jgi:hypothetical protein
MRKWLVLAIALLACVAVSNARKLEFWKPQGPAPWTFWKNAETKVDMASFENEDVRLDVGSFFESLGFFAVGVSIKNKGDREVQFDSGRFYVQDQAETIVSPLSPDEVKAQMWRKFGKTAERMTDITGEYALAPLAIVPARATKPGNICFPEGWVKMRKKQTFQLRIEGLTVGGEKVDLPVLELVPSVGNY